MLQETTSWHSGRREVDVQRAGGCSACAAGPLCISAGFAATSVLAFSPPHLPLLCVLLFVLAAVALVCCRLKVSSLFCTLCPSSISISVSVRKWRHEFTRMYAILASRCWASRKESEFAITNALTFALFLRNSKSRSSANK